MIPRRGDSRIARESNQEPFRSRANAYRTAAGADRPMERSPAPSQAGVGILVIASQCAHWRGNPHPPAADYKFQSLPRRTDCHTSDIGHWFAMPCFFCPNNNLPAANAAGGAVLRLDLRFYLQISFVSRAMTSSSFVGITKTFTLLSGVEIMMSSPRLLLASGSISTPR